MFQVGDRVYHNTKRLGRIDKRLAQTNTWHITLDDGNHGWVEGDTLTKVEVTVIEGGVFLAYADILVNGQSLAKFMSDNDATYRVTVERIPKEV